MKKNLVLDKNNIARSFVVILSLDFKINVMESSCSFLVYIFCNLFLLFSVNHEYMSQFVTCVRIHIITRIKFTIILT